MDYSTREGWFGFAVLGYFLVPFLALWLRRGAGFVFAAWSGLTALLLLGFAVQ
jgi:hypothetical protein